MILDKILLLRLGFLESFGYLLIFLATFLEASPLIGLIIPGSIIIFLAGFFARLDIFSFIAVLIFAISGAILGDLFGYIIGRNYGERFLKIFGKFLFIKAEHIEKSEHIAHAHTGKSLVIGRLNPITRVFAPFIVGMHKIKFSKFMFYNIIGGILWGFIFVSLGYIFGYSYRFAMRFERYIVIGTIIIILAFYMYYFIKLLMKEMED